MRTKALLERDAMAATARAALPVVLVLVTSILAGCRGSGSTAGAPVVIEATLPRVPGPYAPSLATVVGGEVDGAVLADVDGCASCHPDAWAQWSESNHSFASFGNPIYRFGVELARRELGKPASLHCGGCHDMPLVVDGDMTAAADIPAADPRSHNGVTCRLCHGIQAVTSDGNGSYVLRAEPLPIPTPGDQRSIEAHRTAASVTRLGSDLCASCHRGFLSPDLGMPVHLTGIDEPGVWGGSAWTRNGAGRIDTVEPRSCIDCHMGREPAGADEVSAEAGTIASHRFAGGHTWMAAMRGDADQLAATRAMLAGAASIDVAGARVGTPGRDTWHLPADGAPVTAGARLELDVVVRNLSVGHRFPGGAADIQDTWIEIEVSDARGARIAASGLAHASDDDEEAHVLRAMPAGEDGRVLDEHQVSRFRGVIANHTLAPREAQSVRYGFDVPATLRDDQLPLVVAARLRHRTRGLRMQAAVCREASTPAGAAFLVGLDGGKIDPCAPQPITEIAAAEIELGAGARISSARPAWERLYEFGMALAAVVTERLDEPREVLEAALARAPADDRRARAMILVQLASVAGKQGRAADALALLDEVEQLVPAPAPAVVAAVRADALARVWRWEEAIAPARLATEQAPGNTGTWVMLARVLGSAGDDTGALAAARAGLSGAPREPDLLRSQAVALRMLGSPLADPALAAFDRFRSPDWGAALRLECVRESRTCEREREPCHLHELVPAAR